LKNSGGFGVAATRWMPAHELLTTWMSASDMEKLPPEKRRGHLRPR